MQKLTKAAVPIGVVAIVLMLVVPLPAAVIDLSGLTFLDVSGSRALVIGTDELRRAGGRVTFSGASEHLRKVMCLVGMDRLPGIELP